MPKTTQVKIDTARFQAFQNGKIVNIAPKEFVILAALAKAKGRVLSRADILEAFWGSAGARDFDTRTIDQHVSRMRRALINGDQIIVTVTNFGYRSEGVEIIDEKERWGKVFAISRYFKPKPRSRIVVDVDGDVLQELKIGHKFRLP